MEPQPESGSSTTGALDVASTSADPNFLGLDAAKIVSTTELLSQRIYETFPGSGISKLSLKLLSIALQAKARSAWIARPIVGLRFATWILVAIIVAGLIGTVIQLGLPSKAFDFAQFIQVLESGINDVVLIGAAIFFLVTFETRIKRGRALKALHELRVMAHIIDMHQLTKDPERLFSTEHETALSPRPKMTVYALGRYLDYCSEMLSLTGKIAALYIQNFDDPVAIDSVNEIEALTIGLSRKIWQKLAVLHSS